MDFSDGGDDRGGSREGGLTTLHTAKSHIFNSICLRLPGRHGTIERKTIILLRTNKERRKTEEQNGEERPPGESCPRKDGDEMRGTNSGTGGERGGWHGRMADTIVGVAPTTKYYRLFLTQPTRIRGCSHPPDNRTGYVVDLAGNIYELLLPVRSSSRISLSLSLSLFSSFAHSPFFFF